MNRGESTVWLDGRLLPRDEARVSVDDLGFLYGGACFETVRAHGASIFRLDRHFERLEAGLAAMGIASPARPLLREAIAQTLAANQLEDARVRVTVSAGRGHGRPDLSSAAAPTILVVADRLEEAPAARLVVASVRVDEERALRGAKTANYLVSLLALSEARASGCNEALLLNHRGQIAEAATANVFAVIDGVLVTPPLIDGPLPGVTREAVLDLARARSLPAAERSLTLEALSGATEVFLTNSVTGVRPVREVAGLWTNPAYPGPLTSALAEAYAAAEALEQPVTET